MRTRQISGAGHFSQPARRALERTFQPMPGVQVFRLRRGGNKEFDAVIVQRIDEMDETPGGFIQLFPQMRHTLEQQGMELSRQFKIVAHRARALAELLELNDEILGLLTERLSVR